MQHNIAEDPEDPAHREGTTPPRPVLEIMPHLVERHRLGRSKLITPTRGKVTVRLDADIVAHFLSTRRGWQSRLDEALRESVIGL